jgi:hypothetical protein
MLSQVRPYLIIEPSQPYPPLIDQEMQIRSESHLEIKNTRTSIIIRQVIRRYLQSNRRPIHDEPPERS